MLGSRAVQSVSGAIVRSINSVLFFLCFVNVPIASNWTGLVNTEVLVAAGRGVNVGVGVFFLGVVEAVGVGICGGGDPSDIVRDLSLKPGLGVAVALVEPLPPVQLRKIAPETNNTTGETTSHLSHRDINIES